VADRGLRRSGSVRVLRGTLPESGAKRRQAAAGSAHELVNGVAMNKKLPIVIVALVVIAVAVVVALSVDGNQVAAFAGGFDAGCQNCHGPGDSNSIFPHNVPAHQSFFGTCSNCHTGTPGVGTADISKCATCHGGAVTIAQEPAHVSQNCTDCHAATTTTSSTTTSSSTTTTTSPGGSTTTTAPSSTTTTAPSSTTTTLEEEEPSFTG
jgi:hypothetical protein